MDKKLRYGNLIVHLFALAHALSVYLLRYFDLSDELFLSLLTITMIVLVTHNYGFPLEVSAALSVLCCFAGFYMGTIGGKLLASSGVAFVAQFANEITTFCVTEILGWMTIFIGVKSHKPSKKEQ